MDLNLAPIFDMKNNYYSLPRYFQYVCNILTTYKAVEQMYFKTKSSPVRIFLCRALEILQTVFYPKLSLCDFIHPIIFLLLDKWENSSNKIDNKLWTNKYGEIHVFWMKIHGNVVNYIISKCILTRKLCLCQNKTK